MVFRLRHLASLPFDSFRACRRYFQRIDLETHNLRLVHKKPFIFVLPNFFSADECAALRAKADGATRRQGFDDTDAHVTGSRTSSGCTLRDEEVGGLRQRMAALVGVTEEQMQPLKVSRYERGQRFDIHTDAWRGDLRGRPADPADWWADRQRMRWGVPGEDTWSQPDRDHLRLFEHRAAWRTHTLAVARLPGAWSRGGVVRGSAPRLGPHRHRTWLWTQAVDCAGGGARRGALPVDAA